MNEQVAEAQRNIISNLAGWESAIAELYEKYAAALPELADFWGKLAKEERSHAALLNGLLKKIDQGFVFLNIGSFEWESIEREIHVILKALHAINTEGVTAKTALLTAINIESTLMESSFYSKTRSTDPSFKYVADALTSATKEHFSRLQAKLGLCAGQP